MRQANPEFVGSMGATDPENPPASVDLSPVRFGTQTFTNPCFWILVGVVGTLAVQYLLSNAKRKTLF